MGIVFFDLDLLELYYVTINPKSCTTNLSQPIKPHFEYVAKMHKPKWSHRDFINKSDGVKYLDSFASFWGKKKQKKTVLCLIVQGDEMSSFFSSSADSQTQDVFICIGMTVEFI